MEKAVLHDASVFPTEEVIFSHIGEYRVLWQKWLGEVHAAYSGCEEVWRYYNDGKSWLFRLLLKKKTVCWAGLHEDTFRITFYFSDKAAGLIEESKLPETVKDTYRNGKHYGKIRGITIPVKEGADIEHVLILTAIRLRIA